MSDNKFKQEIYYYLSYIIIGMITSYTILGLPYIYLEYGYTEKQISILISVGLAAAALQPLINYFATKYLKNTVYFQLIAIGYILFLMPFSYFNNFNITIALILGVFLFRQSLFPVFDDIVSLRLQHVKGNYGFLRSGGSLGYGIGLFIALAPTIIFGVNVRYTVFVEMIIVIILLILMRKIPYYKPYNFKVAIDKGDKRSQQNNKRILIKGMISLVLLNLFLFGMVSLRLNYQTPYLIERGFSEGANSIIAFIMVIPEIILLPLYSKLSRKKSSYYLFLIVLIIATLQVGILYLVTSKILIVIVLLFHGVITALYIPNYILQQRFFANYQFAKGLFIISYTVQAVGSALINVLFLDEITSISGKYLAISLIILMSLIPLGMIYYLSKKYPKLFIS